MRCAGQGGSRDGGRCCGCRWKRRGASARGGVSNVACRAQGDVAADGLARFHHASQAVGAVGRDPGTNEVGAFDVTCAERERLRGDTFLVSGSRTCTGFEEDAHDLEMAVGSSKVERCGAFGAWPSCGSLCSETRSVDIGAVQDEHAHALFAATGAGGVQRQDAVEVAVGRLAVFESELDKTDVSGGSSAVETQVWVHAVCMTGGAAEAALTDGLEGGATDRVAQHGDAIEPSALRWMVQSDVNATRGAQRIRPVVAVGRRPALRMAEVAC